jgi:hypothetical protein
MSSRVEFINSLADAKALAIYDENKHLLISSPLNMKDSEDAIKAVVNCIRDQPISFKVAQQSTPKHVEPFFLCFSEPFGAGARPVHPILGHRVTTPCSNLNAGPGTSGRLSSIGVPDWPSVSSRRPGG